MLCPDLDTTILNDLLARDRAGDPGARNDLLSRSIRRLEQLARKMLRDFPVVRRWEETGDILQTAMVRLLNALDALNPQSTREYYHLAARQIRWELLDLARRYRGERGLAQVSTGTKREQDDARPVFDPADPASLATEELERWTAFHEAVDHLPMPEREAFTLSFYHGWTQVQVAEMCQVDERTVRRWWRSACCTLTEILEGELPEGNCG